MSMGAAAAPLTAVFIAAILYLSEHGAVSAGGVPSFDVDELSQPSDATKPVQTDSQPAGPNFLYILSDDLGYGEISIMPGRTNFNITTPHIDKLFSEGMRFTDFYANPECAPSRGSLMTGKHSGHSTIRDNHFGAGLRAGDVTFMQLLQQQGGYEVSCIGKWHLSGNRREDELKYIANPEGAPWNKGCSRYFGPEFWAVYYPKDLVWRYDEAEGLREIKFPMNDGASRTRCMAPGNDCVWMTDLNFQEALDELAYHKARQDAEEAAGLVPRPFFMYLAWTEAHLGLWDADGPGSGSGTLGNPVPDDGVFADTDWPDYEKDHAAAISIYHDSYVGALLEQLDSLGLRDDTVVIYSSDNGGSECTVLGHKGHFFESSGPLQGFKQWLTDGGIRVPAAVRWPGRIAAGTVSSEPLGIWDLFPTILSMAGVSDAYWPVDIDGVSFWEGVLQQQPAEDGSEGSEEGDSSGKAVFPSSGFRHPPLYWETCGALINRPKWSASRIGANFERAIREGKWKGLQLFNAGEFSEMRLYDLENDVGETTDVSADNFVIAQRLRNLMDAPGMRSSEAGGYMYRADDVCEKTYGSSMDAILLKEQRKRESGGNVSATGGDGRHQRRLRQDT